MKRKSIKQQKKSRISRKKRLYYGGSKKYMINIHLNLSYVDEERDEDIRLDPTSLSKAYRIEMETHLKNIIPSNDDFKLSGKFHTNYKFLYNNTEEHYINFQIEITYNGDDLTIEMVRDLYSDIFEGDYPFTVEDDDDNEKTYFINTSFDVNTDIN